MLKANTMKHKETPKSNDNKKKKKNNDSVDKKDTSRTHSHTGSFA